MRKYAYRTIALLWALAFLMAVAGCRPMLKGGEDASEMADFQLPRNYVDPNDPGPRPVFPSNVSDALIKKEGETSDNASGKLANDGSREHVYIAMSSGPVTLDRSKVYHWVAEGEEDTVPEGAVIVTSMAPVVSEELVEALPMEGGEDTQNIAYESSSDVSPIVPVATYEEPVQMQVDSKFNMDEVMKLIRSYESAMRARNAEKLRRIFTPDATFKFHMRVPGEGSLIEDYTLDEFAEAHRKGWRVKMDYDYRINDITVAVSDDGEVAIAEGQGTEIMVARGNRVTAKSRISFFVESQDDKLSIIRLESQGELGAMAVDGLR